MFSIFLPGNSYKSHFNWEILPRDDYNQGILSPHFGTFFQFPKRAGGTSPFTPSSYAPVRTAFSCSITIHLSELSSCWIWHLTFWFWRSEYSFCYINWNSSFLAIITKHLSFCSVFWCKFFKKVIVLHHGDNNFLFYFDICNQINTFSNNLKDEEMITSHLMCVINALW